jgi:hypothetical protein
MEQWWNDTDGKTEVLGEKHFPMFPFSTAILTWTKLELNPCLCCEMPATNRLIHGTHDICLS